MKPFHTIAIPHKDILEGRLTMDVFAADLWEVYQNRGPEEYKDADTFFRKTYLTEGLSNLLGIVEKRLSGNGGDPVIQVQTPFGGGKTHSLIAMYHKASQWGAKKVVAVGTVLGPEDTLWGLIEKQLTGKIEKFTGFVSPGKEAIRNLLSDNQPLLILMDEVLEYMTKASGVKVADSTLAEQTLAFLQELTEAVSTLEKVALLVTLPSSFLEHYNEAAERLYQRLQKVAGRVEKIYTPVQENEITKIIRRRLFSSINESEVKKIVMSFVEYADNEGILPAGIQPSEYRDRFLDSYPFMPEVVDTLYHRWGTFSSFQRTRGVLRLLSLVIWTLKSSNNNYISLSDFDLANQEIRQELLKHIDAQFNSVIAADISDFDAGSKKVDNSLGNAYKGLNLGTRTSTTIFMYSFSGGHEQGITFGEIKRSATTTGNPASVIAECADQLKNKLFYLQNKGEKYFFTKQPNLNRIILTTMENIPDPSITQAEYDLIKENIAGSRFKIFIWEENPSNIPDSEDFKLVIQRRETKEVIDKIFTTKGQTPRVYRNTIFVLYPIEAEKSTFMRVLLKQLAYEEVFKESNLNLSEEQKAELKKELKKAESTVKESIRKLYRMLALPSRSGYTNDDLGIPTYGEDKSLDQEVYDKLRTAGGILEKIAPLVIKEKYLTDKDYVLTDQIYQSSLKTPGETRFLDKSVLERGIEQGVQMGMFGLGELRGDKPNCLWFKEQTMVALSGDEIIIKECLCHQTLKADRYEPGEIEFPPETPDDGKTFVSPDGAESGGIPVKLKKGFKLRFRLPKGRGSNIMGTLNYLHSKFNNMDIEISVSDGAISEQEFDDKIKEGFHQLDINFEEE